MSRYIDAEALIKEQWWVEIQGENIDDIAEQIIRQCKQIVKDAPSIDIVRCKECKYKDEIVNYCYENDRDVNADDFYSYGEREGE